jgi:DNA-binding transcriptional LysR family regulator
MLDISGILDKNISRIVMDLATLKLFLQIAATGSFSRAAALSASTQSAVSKRISALENELGARLFERTGRGATLTGAGRVLLPRAEALTSEADGLADLLADDSRAPRQRSFRGAAVGRLALVGDLVAAAARSRHPAADRGRHHAADRGMARRRTDDIGLMSSAPASAQAGRRALFAAAASGGQGGRQCGEARDFLCANELPG